MEIPKTELLDAITPWLVGLMLVEFAIGTWLWVTERARQPLVRFSDALASLLTGLFMQVSNLGLNAIMVFAYAMVATTASLPVWLTGQPWQPPHPFPSQLEQGGLLGLGFRVDLLALGAWVGVYIAIDFAFYWFHRTAHTVNVFWATHVVHHSSEDYNLAVGFRHSAIENLVSGAFYLPLALLGVPWEMFLVCYTLNLAYMFWVHTELVTKLPRWFEFVFSTPSHHRVHHARNPEYLDRNYGGTFILWDRLFGTFRKETTPPVYGITTPLQAFNPLTVNFHYFATLANGLRRMRSLGDSLKYLLAPPGWLPPYLGGPQKAPVVTRESAPPRFEIALPTGWQVYLLGQFILLLVAAAGVLQYATLPDMRVSYLAFWSVFTLTWMISLGGLLERRRWAQWLEGARLCVAIGLSGYYSLGSAWPTVWVVGILGVAVASSIAFCLLLVWPLHPKQWIKGNA